MIAVVTAVALTACGDDGGNSSGTDTGGSTAADSTAGPGPGSSTGSDPDGTTTADSTGGEESGTTTGVDPGQPLEGSCEGVTLLPRPGNTAVRGPWPVGARTLDIDGLTVEAWYPASPGSDVGAEAVQYDIRQALPESEQDKIPDADNPWQQCDCYRDLPLDESNGPYPVILFVHGTAGFRSQSLPQMEHWASRGFVVLAADHPGLWMADTLGVACGQGNTPQDLAGDLGRMLAAVRGEAPGLEVFGDRLDATRIGTAGHSAGGNAVSGTGDDAQVIIPMAAGGVAAGSALTSSLVLGALSDSVVPFSSQSDGYDGSPTSKRLVGIANTGHLAFANLCSLTNTEGQDLVEIATEHDVCGVQFASFLFQCDDSFLPDPEAWEIINFASSAVLEETLHCEPEASAELGLIQGTYPVVLEFREEL